jgi:hypothetical protein
MEEQKMKIRDNLEELLCKAGVVRYDILYNNPVNQQWSSRDNRILKDWKEKQFTNSTQSANDIYDDLIRTIMNKYNRAAIDFLSSYYNNLNDLKTTIEQQGIPIWHKESSAKQSSIIYSNNWEDLFPSAEDKKNNIDIKRSDTDLADFKSIQDTLCDEMFNKTDVSGVYICPSFMEYQNKTILTSYVVVISVKPIDITVANNLIVQLGNYTASFATKKIVEIFTNIIKQESIKSAVAAIMSRNMSHNLGSHLITNTKNYLSKRAEQENDPDLRGISHLLQYIQERMDYIATVTSGDKYPMAALNVRTQLFDELNIDYKGKRHNKEVNNFLLEYLVYSEKLTRYHNTTLATGFKELEIKIRYDGKDYTGLNSKTQDEKDIQMKLSKLNLAVPQGVMARHALFSIIENIVRNSAKHAKSDKDLLITIDLQKSEDNKSITITIYDNRKNANSKTKEKKKDANSNDDCYTVLELMHNKLEKMQIIDNTGALDKKDKGLKEILISVLWLKNKDISSLLNKMQNESSQCSFVKKEAFNILEVDGNLAYQFNLPVFSEEIKFDAKAGILDIYADVVKGEKDAEYGEVDMKRKCEQIFTRYFDNSEEQYPTDENRLKYCIEKNLNIKLDEYKICIESTRVNLDNYAETVRPAICMYDDDIKKNKNVQKDKLILFRDHLSNKEDVEETLEAEFAYVDSISGENFTSTLIQPDFLNDTKLRYKVIESALTKIAIIDERIFERFKSPTDNKESIEELKMKKQNIFIYTIEFKENEQFPKILNLSNQNKYAEKEIEKVDFLSIHLSLLEKWQEQYSGKISEILNGIKDKFGGRDSVFVVIHSGRGNYSDDLDKELGKYPYSALSGIEAVLYNSKYQLSQFFYNTVYYGKGYTNK